MIVMTCGKAAPAAAVLLRLALAAAFFSAVADRFGFWGEAGDPGVSWGSFDSFLDYADRLLWFLPPALIPAFGWGATVLEIVLGSALIVGVATRWAALAGGLLLTTFAATMTAALGPKPPLSHSVWTAAAASFLLASLHHAPRPVVEEPVEDE